MNTAYWNTSLEIPFLWIYFMRIEVKNQVILPETSIKPGKCLFNNSSSPSTKYCLYLRMSLEPGQLPCTDVVEKQCPILPLSTSPVIYIVADRFLLSVNGYHREPILNCGIETEPLNSLYVDWRTCRKDVKRGHRQKTETYHVKKIIMRPAMKKNLAPSRIGMNSLTKCSRNETTAKELATLQSFVPCPTRVWSMPIRAFLNSGGGGTHLY